MRDSTKKIIIAVIIAAAIAAPALCAILFYTQPTNDAVYDLSMITGDGEKAEFEEKGWTAFTAEGEKITRLTLNETGGYSGLSYAGQTFYFSREIKEGMENAKLSLGALNKCVSVFIDGELIYTDSPTADNRIGYLALPMLASDREAPLMLTLPPDCAGKTLTIAEASSPFSEKQPPAVDSVYPCSVIIYTGSSYESGTSAEAVRIVLPAALLFALAMVMIILFIWNASMGQLTPSLPILTLTLLFQMCSILSKAGFFYQYISNAHIDFTSLCFYLSVCTLLAFLSIYAGGLRNLFFCLTAFCALSVIICGLTQADLLMEYGSAYRFLIELPQRAGFLALLAALICSFLVWRRESRFFRRFSGAAALITAGYAGFLLLSLLIMPEYAKSVLARFSGDLELLLPNFLLKLLWSLCLFSSAGAIVLELFSQETERRAERAALVMQKEMAAQSYENLRRHSDEVMMLRHDMAKHYSLLREMAESEPQKLAGYLDELLRQEKSIVSFVESGNRLIDLMLSSRLSAARDNGLAVEILRADAPAALPLDDTELCCLVMNILDNAVSAACKCEAGSGFIRLDLHHSDTHFVFSCENSKTDAAPNRKGYGVKIINKIAERWGDCVFVEEEPDVYKVTVVIPL